MVRARELSKEMRAQVHILSKEGLTQRAIAEKLKISRSCVCKTLQRIQETNSFKSRSRSGRPRVTNERTDRSIHRYAMRHPTACASEIRANLPRTRCVPSINTIKCRLLQKCKLRSYKPATKPLLSRKNIKDRIRFCKQYEHWTFEEWSKVMFSDETIISQFRSNRPFVRRPVKQRYNPRYVINSTRSAPKVMIWGAITANGRAGLHFVPAGETVNAERYLKIIKEKVPPFMAIRSTTILQQDGAPAHKSKEVQRWVNSNDGFTLLRNWPGNSPDLSPIENCWSFIKSKLQEKQCSSKLELIEMIKSVWTTEISHDYCQRLFQSMPRRISECLRKKGGHTKY